jgi:hypothetical protein
LAGRPRKNVSQTQTPKQDSSNTLYTLENTANRWTNLFSSKYGNCDLLLAMQNALSKNPYVQNQRLKQLKSYPVFYDRNTLEIALQSPQSNEQTLREASYALSSSVFPLYKLMRMYPDILTYKGYAYSKYVPTKDLNTPRYKSDSKIVHMFLDKFKPKYTFRRIAQEVFKEGKRAYIYRQSINTETGKEKVDYALLQELASDWWKPTYKGADNYIGASFNFTYFWQVGTSIDQFPPVFRQYYEELMGCTNKTSTGYEIDYGKAPQNSSVEFTGGNWFFWKELPNDLCFVFSCDESNVWIVPPFISLFLQAQDLSNYLLLQQQLTSIPLNSIVLGEIPFHDNGSGSKSGGYTNDLRLNDTMVTGFLDMFNGIAPSGSSMFAAPFQNMKLFNFPQVPNGEKIYTEALQQFIGSAAVNGLQTTSEKPSISQVKAAMSIEAGFADVLYDQFMNCINVIFEKWLNLKFCWRYKIFGDRFSDKDTIQSLKDGLSMGQSYLLPKYAAMHDLDIEDTDALANQVKSSGIYNKMIMVKSAFQSSDKKNGRPINEDPMSDGTGNSQDSGMNTAEGRTFTIRKCLVCGEEVDKDLYPFCSEECMEEFKETNYEEE